MVASSSMPKFFEGKYVIKDIRISKDLGLYNWDEISSSYRAFIVNPDMLYHFIYLNKTRPRKHTTKIGFAIQLFPNQTLHVLSPEKLVQWKRLIIDQKLDKFVDPDKLFSA